MASQEDVIISTVLGSCVSVTLFDTMNHWGGMNHFLLPETDVSLRDTQLLLKDETRYGVYAMEILINSLLKMGSRKINLKAKVFGGSDMFEMKEDGKGIGQMNILFALKFLENEEIPVLSSDTGGSLGRKILFFPKEGRVLVKKLKSARNIRHIAKDEKKYEDSFIIKKDSNDIVLF